MRTPHMLKANKTLQRFRRVIYFDSESRLQEEPDRIIHLPYLICGTFCDYSQEREFSKDYFGEGFNDLFWDDVIRWCNKGKTYIIAHNANYDTLVTGGIPRIVKAGFRATSFYSAGTTFILEFTKKEQKKSICIISSTNIYATSLAKLAETFGMKKMEVDYNESTLEEVLPYCRNDVAIMKHAMESFFDFIEEEGLGTQARTIASQAFNAFRYRFMEHDIMIHSSENALTLERQAYSGGRVEVFQKGTIQEPVYYLDVNSMYPYVMKTFRYPTCISTYKTRCSLPELERYLEQYLIVAKVKVRTEEPVYPKKIKGRLIFPVGEFITVLSTPEIQYALERNDIVDVYEVALYRQGNVFGKYVDYFYNRRKQAKEQGDKVRSDLYKLFLNSLYGKFGQRGDSWEPIGEEEPETIYQEKTYNVETGEISFIKCFGGTVFKRVDETESYNSFPAIAAHVTAYARMTLWGYIQVAGIENVLYADTDSLFVTEKGYQNLGEYIDTYELGALKLEKQAGPGQVTINAPKDYIFGEEIKLKGIPRNATKTEQGYKVVMWGKLSAKMEQKDFDGYSNTIRYKQQTGRILKSWIDETGRSVPFEIRDEWINEPWFGLQDEEQISYVYKHFGQGDPKKYNPQRESENIFADWKKVLRQDVVKLGGVMDKDYTVPKHIRRKDGYTLDELVAELNNMGYRFEDANDLYEQII
jgi:hypothetical protein